jgi:hypothetical protein
MLICSCVFAHSSAHIDRTRGKTIKVDKGFIILWDMESIEPDVPQVTVRNLEGHVVTTVKVLQPAIEASAVGIYDVAIRPGKVIAVAVVYRSRQRHIRPVSSLLTFDFRGRLLSAFALKPSRGISHLVLDDDENIWTLTDHADTEDPSKLPMVVEYSAEGTVVKELLTRSMFPMHSAETNESSFLGRAAIGYDSGTVWFWLPGSKDLVTISAALGTTSRIQLPSIATHNGSPHEVLREPSGTVVTQIHAQGLDGNPDVGDYTWTPESGTWSRLEHTQCQGGRLIGTSDKSLIFLVYSPDRTYDAADICILQGR